jgi:hypothetical protein
VDPIRDGYDAVGSSPDRLSGHCIGIAESTTQPFKLGVYLIKGLDAEIDRATDELSHLRDMLESEED